MYSTNKKAFSLIELLVTLGVISVLIVMGIAGFRIVQKNSRDNERINMLSKIGDEINTYKLINGRYPATNIVKFEDELLIINEEATSVKLNRYLSPSTGTTKEGTKYYYENLEGGFALCVLLESGKIESGGSKSCPTNI
jgi:prepilin-type N-terminal cleavage/methylation domain-containing protein